MPGNQSGATRRRVQQAGEPALTEIEVRRPRLL